MQHSLIKSWIGRMTVRFPTAIQKVDLDGTADGITSIDSNRSITKVRSGFAVPCAELDDIDFIASCADEVFSEISGKPASLQLQFRWDSRREEKRTLTNAIGIA
jgi:hypothetical protein